MAGTLGVRSARCLAGFLAFAGTSHFVVPAQYDALVPRVLPGPARFWTYVSGVAELACATLIARKRTRRLGARLAFWLFIAVFPGNVQMAVDWRDRPPLPRAVSLVRLPLQVPLLIWARRVRDRGTAP
jgi:uncharacterized membrane protein